MRCFRVLDPLFRLVPVLLLAFALCWQAGIVRTHVHGGPVWKTARAHHAPLQRDSALDCPICAEAGTAAAYLGADAPVFPAPLARTPWREAVAVDPLPHPLRAHDWRSRAPPALRAA